MSENEDLELRAEHMGEDMRRALGVIALLKARKEALQRLDALENQSNHAHDVAHRALEIAKESRDTSEKNAQHIEQIEEFVRSEFASIAVGMALTAGLAMLAFHVLQLHRQEIDEMRRELDSFYEEFKTLRREVAR